MRQEIERAAVITAAGISLIICLLIISAVSPSHQAQATTANGTPTPSATPAMVYLPYIVREEPPTPTPTPTPTYTPTPTPTSIPPGVHILPNHFSYVRGSYLHVVGEVQNNTANPVAYIEINVNIFDSAGRLLDTDFTYPYLDALAAGKKTCFDLLLEEPPGWAYYEFESPTYLIIPSSSVISGLTIFNHSGLYYLDDGHYEIIGQVRNDSSIRAEYVSPVGTLYNTWGVVIGCDFTYVNSTHLDPGQTSAFKMIFYDRDYGDVTSYHIQVEGIAQQEALTFPPAP